MTTSNWIEEIAGNAYKDLQKLDLREKRELSNCNPPFCWSY